MTANEYTAIKSTYERSLIADSKSRDTLNAYMRTLDRYGEFCEQRGMDACDPQTIVEFKAYLHERGNKSSTIALLLMHLKCFFNFAVAVKACKESPCTSAVLKIKKEQRKPYEQKITENDFLRILYGERPMNMKSKTYLRNKAILIVLLTSAIRNSELRHLRLCDLDFEKGSIRVINGKGGKTRYAPFPSIAQDCVMRYLHSGYRNMSLTKEDYLFGVNSANGWRQLDRNELSELVRRSIQEYTGRKDVRSHALRHTSASIMRTYGLDIESISEILGHENVQTTRIYAEWLDGAAPTKAGNALFDRLGGRVNAE